MPLRDRREDIPLLAQHFLTQREKALKSDLRLSEGDARRLIRYDWPGNVARTAERDRARGDPVAERPLADRPAGYIRRASLTGAARLKADARPAVMTSSEMRDHERANILAALDACAGKRCSAPAALRRCWISSRPRWPRGSRRWDCPARRSSTEECHHLKLLDGRSHPDRIAGKRAEIAKKEDCDARPSLIDSGNHWSATSFCRPNTRTRWSRIKTGLGIRVGVAYRMRRMGVDPALRGVL